MKPKILIYTFYNWRGLSFKLVRELDKSKVDVYYLGSLSVLCKMITTRNYDYIIGLGDYNKLAKNIRIETKFINRKGKSSIVENAAEYLNSNWQLSVSNGVIISDKTTNGPCNRSAYTVQKLINDKSLKMKFCFAHVPRKLNLDIARDVINKWLSSTG